MFLARNSNTHKNSNKKECNATQFRENCVVAQIVNDEVDDLKLEVEWIDEVPRVRGAEEVSCYCEIQDRA